MTPELEELDHETVSEVERRSPEPLSSLGMGRAMARRVSHEAQLGMSGAWQRRAQDCTARHRFLLFHVLSRPYGHCTVMSRLRYRKDVHMLTVRLKGLSRLERPCVLAKTPPASFFLT